ncbi:MAG: sulfatase-like hydrolase/transferase [Lachnospiraceae bacterium]|nr:sulfatase-like hydrolase/transferase [Lachnospiraceae bacterium]
MNCVIIFTDQHSKNVLGCYGNPYVKTPNLDLMAAEGVCFDQAYTSCPVCVPARAAMAIGNYGSRYQYWDNAYGYDGRAKSWAGRLGEQDYDVTTIGKLHFINAGPETGFRDQRIPLHIKDGVGDVYGEIRDHEITRPQFRNAILNAKDGSTDYIIYDREIARQSVEFLKEKGERAEKVEQGGYHEKPFTLLTGFVTPHFPLTVPKEYLDLYPDESSIRIPVEFEREQWPHHPVLDDYRRYCCTENLTREEGIRAIRVYYGLCSFMDEQVGKVLQAIKDNGLAENTRIIYCTDHGDCMGDHGLFFKSTMYEGSAGIPLILSGPDIPKGERRDTSVSLVDIYPTVMDCVGAVADDYDRALPGTSLIPLAEGASIPDRAVYSEYLSFGIYTGEYMIRKNQYKLMYFVNERPMLFDLSKGTEETVNLAEDEAYQDVLCDMISELKKVTDPEKTEADARKAQEELLNRFGGREEFLENFKPSLFSPIPKW